MSEEDEKLIALFARYERACHAMQSGVAMEMHQRPQPTEPKHLRVGVNSAMVDHSALANLLIKKKIITKVEYYTVIAEGMEKEVEDYEIKLSRMLNTKITLI